MLRSLVLALVVATIVSVSLAQAGGRSYYLDCSHGNDAAGGLSPGAAWRTVHRVDTASFRPGDRILLRRGTRCSGMLAPRGSGAAGAPIVIDAYGTGPLPVVVASSQKAAISLFDQHDWEIAHVETVGGNPRGISISGSHGTLGHFRVTDVVVHGVTGKPVGKDSGLIDVEPRWGSSAQLDDVVIDGARVYGTTQWFGIHIGCKGASVPATNSHPVVIRNSTAHDVAGDGITIFSCSDGLLEDNVAYNTGQIHTKKIGTPNAIWTWSCRNCTVQGNEGYASGSPDVDGGIYDIDFHSTNTTVQYNYGHDAQGYCIAVFGAEHQPTTNSVVRYNVCANNARKRDLAWQGDVQLSTWNGGSLDGVAIYNNTFFWNPVVSSPLVDNSATFAASSRAVFANNLVYSTVPDLVDSNGSLTFDHNLYWTTSSTPPTWKYAGQKYAGFSAYQSGAHQDAHGRYADPHLASPTYHGTGKPAAQFKLQPGSPAIDAGARLPAMGAHDFYGDPIPHGAGYDIGADEH